MALFDKLLKRDKVIEPITVDEYERKFSDEEMSIMMHEVHEPQRELTKEEKELKLMEDVLKTPLPPKPKPVYKQVEVSIDDKPIEAFRPKEEVKEIEPVVEEAQVQGPVLKLQLDEEEPLEDALTEEAHDIVIIEDNDDKHDLINLDVPKVEEKDHKIIYVKK